MTLGVTASDDWSYRSNRAVILENEFLKVSVFPELGAKIYELYYKPAHLNLLWHHPRIRPRKVSFGATFDDVWSGGWDEIFPNDAPSVVEGQSYPDMGEAWSIPWDYSIDYGESSRSATLATTTMTPISAAKLNRSLTLRQGEARVDLRYNIQNIGQDTLKFLWKIHPAFNINETCSIEIPARTGIVDSRYRNLYSETSHEYEWPVARNSGGGTVDLSKVSPSSAKTCSLHYVTDLNDGLIALRNPRDNVDIRIRFDKQIMHTVWLFLAYGGYRSLYTAVVEPGTSYPYDLGKAIKEGRCSQLEPGQELSCTVEVQVSAHSGA